LAVEASTHALPAALAEATNKWQAAVILVTNCGNI
jgi:hypothetical protein